MTFDPNRPNDKRKTLGGLTGWDYSKYVTLYINIHCKYIQMVNSLLQEIHKVTITEIFIEVGFIKLKKLYHN